jgi:hypothetical protein
MFVGTEHITLSNHELADEALSAAYSMCSTDPLLINERGVMAFLHGEYVTIPVLPSSTAEIPRPRYQVRTCGADVLRGDGARTGYADLTEGMGDCVP